MANGDNFVRMWIPANRVQNARSKLNRIKKTADNRGISFDFDLPEVSREDISSKEMSERRERLRQFALTENPDDPLYRSVYDALNMEAKNFKAYIIPPADHTEQSITRYRRYGSELKMSYDDVSSMGWQVVAVLKPASEAYFYSNMTSNYMVNTIPNLSDIGTISEHLPHELNSFCEHCGTVRRRNELFVVHNKEQDTYARVGSTCLFEYTAIDPKFTMSFYEFIETPSFGDPSLLKKSPKVQDLYDFMEKAVRLFDYADSYIKGIGRSIFESYIKDVDGDSWLVPFGYPKSRGLTNGEIMMGAFQPSILDKYCRRISPSSEKIDDMITMMISYVMQLNARSDFEYNLKRIVDAGVVSPRTAGYAASIYTVYRRAEEKGLVQAMFFPQPPEESEDEGMHFGEIGDRIEFTAKVMRKQVREGYYGDTTMLVFEVLGGTHNGSEVVWWSSSSKRMPSVGDVVNVRGTVKKHGEFKGKKITTITRGKISEAGDYELAN